MSPPRPVESGFMLIELVIAIGVLALGVIAVLGALQFGILSGRVQRELSTGELTLRGFAEHVKGEGYVACAAPTDYEDGFTEPAGTTASVIAVTYWDGVPTTGGDPLTYVEDCEDEEDDFGLQLVHVRVDASGPAAALDTLVVKRAG